MNNGIVNRLFLAALLFVCTDLCGQNVQIKTNLLYDATATINIGSECRLGRPRSLDLSASYNVWAVVRHLPIPAHTTVGSCAVTARGNTGLCSRKAATGSAPPSRGIMSVCTSTAAR